MRRDSILVNDGDGVLVPSAVARCPECGGRIEVTVFSFFNDERRGQVNPANISATCAELMARMGERQQRVLAGEQVEMPQPHRWDPVVWGPVNEAVTRWTVENVRRREDEAEEE